MSIFGIGVQMPTRINRVQINQSVLGYPLPVVMGKCKVQQSLLWVDGLTAKSVSAGGKGIGGGKGGSQYLYSADVIAALCNGPISSIGDVWSAGSWLSNNNATESYAIGGGSPSYTPANAGSGFFCDLGVMWVASYGGTYNDLGSSTPTVLSGSDNVSYVQVPYGSTLTTGQYSIDPSTNTYHFPAADAGRTVTINYSFALNIIKQQEQDLVPSSKNIAVGGTFTFHEDDGVVYNSGPNIGKSLTKVSGTPSATGTYSVSGSGPATYHFAAGDIGVLVIITYKIQNNSAVPQGAPGTLNFSVYEGTKGQSPWSLLTGTFPGAALGYTAIAYVAYSPMTLGYAADVQQNVLEVLTPDSYGGGIVDCNPIQCILQVLTNPIWGLGAGAVPFPTSAIDNGSSGTWGKAPSTPGTRTVNGTAWAWFAANSFFISPGIDHQDTAASLISLWLEAGQCAAFMSEGLLKLVPYGDTSAAANGCTWTAPSAFAAALDDTCFIPKQEGEDPVKISSKPWQDSYNTVQVQWENRVNQYAPEITPESDQAAINRYGARIEDPQNWDFIHTLQAATFAASMRVKRGVYTRNTYEFTVPFAYSFLECMDVVDITTSSAWAAGLNNANLGIVNLPVRITKIVDNPEGHLDITAEDYPFGVHQPTIYNKALAAGQTQQNIFADPGNSEVVLFEATNRLTGYQGNQIWIGASGASDDWGTCNVFVSYDGTTYKQVGTIDKQARLGILDSTFATGTDPDTVNSLVVDLAENSPALESATTTDADQGNTLCFVDGEIVSYSACTVTGQDQYEMSGYIRRGQMGSVISAHAASGLFLRLDDAVFKYTYDPTWAGKSLYLKFQSVNHFGNAAQDLSTLTPVTFTVPGLNPGTVDASSGLVINNGIGYGKNCLGNPGFESRAGNYTTVTVTNQMGQIVADSWIYGPSDTTLFGVRLDTYLPHGGGYDMLVNLNLNVIVPNDGVTRYGCAESTPGIPVRAGDTYTVTGWARIDTSTALPSGLAVAALYQLQWLDSNGNTISTANTPTVGPSSSDTLLSVTAVAPAGAATLKIRLINSVVNTSGAAINTGTNFYGGARFDDIMVTCASSLDTEVTDGTTYRRPIGVTTTHQLGSAGNVPVNVQAMISSGSAITQSGTSKTIDIAAGTLQTGAGAVNYNSGSVTVATYTEYYIYAHDPTFAGGAVTYIASTNAPDVFANDGNVYFGSITITSGGGGSGGGPGGGGGHGTL